jgi:predicted ATPase
MTTWLLLLQGYPDRARVRSDEALARARELGHPHVLALALHHDCIFRQLRRDRQTVEEQSAALMSLTAEQGFAHWHATGMIFHGWARAAGGEVEPGLAEMRRGLAAQQATGAHLKVPYYLGLIAGQADRAAGALPLLAEALARVERTGERWFEAELHRLRGDVLRRLCDDQLAAAEVSFLKSREIARTQQAKAWELRAAISLAQLWRDQGKRGEARDLLAPIYGWFTEGFDTLDLKEAKALLNELRG